MGNCYKSVTLRADWSGSAHHSPGSILVTLTLSTLMMQDVMLIDPVNVSLPDPFSTVRVPTPNPYSLLLIHSKLPIDHLVKQEE